MQYNFIFFYFQCYLLIFCLGRLEGIFKWLLISKDYNSRNECIYHYQKRKRCQFQKHPSFSLKTISFKHLGHFLRLSSTRTKYSHYMECKFRRTENRHLLSITCQALTYIPENHSCISQDIRLKGDNCLIIFYMLSNKCVVSPRCKAFFEFIFFLENYDFYAILLIWKRLLFM